MCLHVSRTLGSSDIWLKLPDLALSLLTFQIPFLGSFLFSFLTVQQMKNTSNLMFLLNLFIFFYLLCKPCFPVCHLLITICNLHNGQWNKLENDLSRTQKICTAVFCSVVNIKNKGSLKTTNASHDHNLKTIDLGVVAYLKNECLSGYAFKSFHTYGSSILFAYSSLGCSALHISSTTSERQ